MKSILLIKKSVGLVEMTFGLVNASFSLPEWQAVKILSLHSEKGLPVPGLFPSRKRVLNVRVKGTACSELCGVMYVKPSFLKSHAGRIRD